MLVLNIDSRLDDEVVMPVQLPLPVREHAIAKLPMKVDELAGGKGRGMACATAAGDGCSLAALSIPLEKLDLCASVGNTRSSVKVTCRYRMTPHTLCLCLNLLHAFDLLARAPLSLVTKVLTPTFSQSTVLGE